VNSVFVAVFNDEIIVKQPFFLPLYINRDIINITVCYTGKIICIIKLKWGAYE